METTEAISKKWRKKNGHQQKKFTTDLCVCVCVPAFCMNFGKNVKQFQFKYKTHGNDNLA